MANGAPAWLIAVPCRQAEEPHDAASPGVRLRDLSTRDKCEVASVLGAGLASMMCVLLIGTAMVSRPILSARPLALAVADAPHLSPSALFTPRPVPAVSRPIVSRRASDPPMLLAASYSAGHLGPRPLEAMTLVARADLSAGAARKGPGPLKRVLFGSGQYRVQPFPTVAEQQED